MAQIEVEYENLRDQRVVVVVEAIDYDDAQKQVLRKRNKEFMDDALCIMSMKTVT